MIFVSHAWINKVPDPRVLSFANFLRAKGYEAKCDIMFQQEETSIDFNEMMSTALRIAEKVIIVLSKNYKIKADNYSGGVGVEYRYIINDFSINANKYILVSFGGRDSNIIPDFIKGRDIVDLSLDEKNNYTDLFSKLSSVPKYNFAPVAAEKTIPISESIDPFTLAQSSSIAEDMNLSFIQNQPFDDISKKKFIKESFEAIKWKLNLIAKEFTSKYSFYVIDCDEIDKNTIVFNIFRNGKQNHSIQLWYGNSDFGKGYNIYINNSPNRKNTYSEIIECVEVEGMLKLHFTMSIFNNQSDMDIKEAVKHIWENKFAIYLRLD